jgi:hypothetical protein
MNHAITPQNKSWFIASRWQELDGEMRTALLRGILVIAFYSAQLINYAMTESIQEAGRNYHRQITLAAMAWLCISLAVFITLKASYLPSLLKYISSTCDLAIIGVLAYLGNGAASPLVFTLVYRNRPVRASIQSWARLVYNIGGNVCLHAIGGGV